MGEHSRLEISKSFKEKEIKQLRKYREPIYAPIRSEERGFVKSVVEAFENSKSRVRLVNPNPSRDDDYMHVGLQVEGTTDFKIAQRIMDMSIEGYSARNVGMKKFKDKDSAKTLNYRLMEVQKDDITIYVGLWRTTSTQMRKEEDKGRIAARIKKFAESH